MSSWILISIYAYLYYTSITYSTVLLLPCTTIVPIYYVLSLLANPVNYLLVRLYMTRLATHVHVPPRCTTCRAGMRAPRDARLCACASALTIPSCSVRALATSRLYAGRVYAPCPRTRCSGRYGP